MPRDAADDVRRGAEVDGADRVLRGRQPQPDAVPLAVPGPGLRSVVEWRQVGNLRRQTDTHTHNLSKSFGGLGGQENRVEL